jgi:glutaredoxin
MTISSVLQKYANLVKGEKKGDILVFSLSRCAWCKRTKQLLNDMGVEYSYIDADLVRKEDRQELMETLETWNPACIFPTVVIDNHTCIIGTDESTLKEVLESPRLAVINDSI